MDETLSIALKNGHSFMSVLSSSNSQSILFPLLPFTIQTKLSKSFLLEKSRFF